MKAELVADAHAQLGEGPIWDARANELLWVDIRAHLVHRFDPETGEDRAFDVGSSVGAVVPRAAGGYALAVAAGFATADDAGEVTPLVEVGHDDTIRMNDGACDRGGRFWAGSMYVDESNGGGCLYRLDPDHSVTTICGGVSISNGLAWSLDDTRLYFIDTPMRTVDVWDYDPVNGAVSNRRVAFDVEGPGMPDGMVADAEGGLWVAMWGGSCVRRYTPDGELTAVIEVPAAHATKPAFGGPDLSDLYITSALGGGEHAGGLFVARPGVRGLPANAFAG